MHTSSTGAQAGCSDAVADAGTAAERTNDEIKRLRAENAELHARLHAGPEPEAWAAWLDDAVERLPAGGNRRLLMLKGQLLQEEWAARKLSGVLAKQQAALLHVQQGAADPAACGSSKSDATSALENAIALGRNVLDASAMAPDVESDAAAAVAELRKPAAELLGALDDVRGCLKGCRDGAHAQDLLRACVASVLALGLPGAPPGGRGGAKGAPAPEASPALLSCGSLDVELKALEAQCEWRATRAALRRCGRRMAQLADAWGTELAIVGAELQDGPSPSPGRRREES